MIAGLVNTFDEETRRGRHAGALAEVFKAAGVCDDYTGLSPDARFDLLARELDESRPLIPTHLTYSPDGNEVIETFRTASAVACAFRPSRAVAVAHPADACHTASLAAGVLSGAPARPTVRRGSAGAVRR